jgi:Recombinase
MATPPCKAAKTDAATSQRAGCRPGEKFWRYSRTRAYSQKQPMIRPMLQNRIYRGEIVHNKQSHLGEHEPIIDQPLWDAVQTQLAGNAAQRNEGEKTRQPSLLAGMLFDRNGNRMTPSHACSISAAGIRSPAAFSVRSFVISEPETIVAIARALLDCPPGSPSCHITS